MDLWKQENPVIMELIMDYLDIVTINVLPLYRLFLSVEMESWKQENFVITVYITDWLDIVMFNVRVWFLVHLLLPCVEME